MNVVAQTGLLYKKDGQAAGRSASLVALLFSLAMLAIPWEEIAGRRFEDKEIYIEKFTYLQSVVDEKEIASLREFFFNEALWDLIVRGASDFFRVPVAVVLGVITFFCLFSFARYLAKRHGPMSVLLLINPLVIDFAFSQLRLALAISLVMLTLSLRRKVWVLVLILLASFIHTAIVLFVAMSMVTSRLIRRFERKRIPVVYWGLAAIGVGLVVSLMIGPLREGLLSYVGDRRAEYEMRGASLSYASFWILTLLAIPLQKKKFFRHDGNLLAVACISTMVGATIFGITGVRFVSATFPFVVSSVMSMTRPLNKVLIAAFFLYAGVQWYYWLQ